MLVNPTVLGAVGQVRIFPPGGCLPGHSVGDAAVITLSNRDLDGAAQRLRALPEPVLAVYPGVTDPRRR